MAEAEGEGVTKVRTVMVVVKEARVVVVSSVVVETLARRIN